MLYHLCVFEDRLKDLAVLPKKSVGSAGGMMPGDLGSGRTLARRVLIAIFTGIVLGGVMVPLFSACNAGGNSGGPAPKRVVDLSPVLTEDLPVRQFGHRAAAFLGVEERIRFSPIRPARAHYSFGLNAFEIPSHIGAHLDAPGRLLKGGERADQVPLEKLVGPARLIDLRWKDRHSQIQITDLENYTILQGEIILLFVGYTQPQEEDWPTYASLSVQAAQWLAARKVRAVATDMPSLGSLSRYADLLEKDRPPEEVWAETLAFFHAGIPVVEGLTNLAELVDQDPIMFVGFPLAVADRSGAPMRAAALLY